MNETEVVTMKTKSGASCMKEKSFSGVIFAALVVSFASIKPLMAQVSSSSGDNAFNGALQNGFKEISAKALPLKASVHAVDQKTLDLLDSELVQAAMSNNLGEVQYLLSRGADANAREKGTGITPLMGAAQNGSAGMIQALLARGADVNAEDNISQTALMFVTSKDAAIELLVNHADVNVRDNNGKTALMFAVDNMHVDVAIEIMAHQADVNAQNDQGDTSLMIAAWHGSVNMTEILLAHQADMNIQDVYGDSALMYAVTECHEGAAKVLLSHRADVNLKSNNGDTALTLSAKKDCVMIVNDLLTSGQDMSAQDKSVALAIALDNGYADEAQLLRAHGAMKLNP